MRTFLGLTALSIALAAASSTFAASLERYQSFLNGTQSARAQFEQKVYDRDGRLTQESRGNFVFKRPGRFRWVYDKPADQVIVGDGQRVWIYDRQLNQVTVRKMTAALGSTPAALLSGGTGVERSFEMTDAGEKDGLEWIEAKPKDREAGFERVRMGFDKENLQAMELTDNFGQTTRLSFSNFVRNPQVNPNEFRFDPPKGADVLGDK
jgi:outer membrane lipoprotein carrier protein